ncbi:hypothetical protein AAEH95_03910 [Shewanella xiamenensis]|uniref:hypothetical protein n=1 Tax=Shewanella xiamenensis TaxID=332186 RepID=UPI00313BFF11
MNIKYLIKIFLSIFFFVFFAKVIGLFKDITLASKFGLNSELDAYFYIFNISVLFSGVWLSILTVVVIPFLSKVNDNHRFRQLATDLRKANQCITIVISLLFAIYLIFFDDYLIRNKDKWNYIFLGVSILYCGFQASFYSSVLMTKGNNSNSLLESFPSLLTLFFVLIFYSVSSVIFGTVLGFMFYYFITYFMSSRYFIRGTLFSEQLELSFELKQIGKGVALLLFGQLILSCTSLLDQYFLSSIEDGGLTLFNYANKLLLIVTGISTIVLTRTFIPFFSTNSGFSKVKVLFFSIFILFIFCFFVQLLLPHSSSLVRYIYGYGKFDSVAILEVSKLFNVILYQAPFFISSLILLSYFSSKKFYYPFLYTGILGFVTKISYLHLYEEQLDVFILANSIVIMYVINFFVLIASLCFFNENKNE